MAIDIVEISTGRRAVQESATSLEDESDDANEHKGNLFTCPVGGCVKLFQRYSSLENHLQYGTCNIVHERVSESSTKTSFCMVLVSNQSG